MGYNTQAKLSIIMNLKHAQQWRGMRYALCTGLVQLRVHVSYRLVLYIKRQRHSTVFSTIDRD